MINNKYTWQFYISSLKIYDILIFHQDISSKCVFSTSCKKLIFFANFTHFIFFCILKFGEPLVLTCVHCEFSLNEQKLRNWCLIAQADLQAHMTEKTKLIMVRTTGIHPYGGCASTTDQLPLNLSNEHLLPCMIHQLQLQQFSRSSWYCHSNCRQFISDFCLQCQATTVLAKVIGADASVTVSYTHRMLACFFGLDTDKPQWH